MCKACISRKGSLACTAAARVHLILRAKIKQQTAVAGETGKRSRHVCPVTPDDVREERRQLMERAIDQTSETRHKESEVIGQGTGDPIYDDDADNDDDDGDGRGMHADSARDACLPPIP